PAHAVALFGRLAVTIEHSHVAIGEAADRAAVVAQKIHALAQHRLDIVEIHLALGGVGVAPILARADETNVVVRFHAQALAIANKTGRAARRHFAGLRLRDTVAHAAPIGVLHDVAAQTVSEHRHALRPAERGEQRL